LVEALLILVLAQSADYQQGVALIDRGDPAAAIPLLTRAIEADPKNAQSWKALGVAHAALKQYSEAEAAFGRACTIDYKTPDACFFQARALYALGRYEETLTSLAHADPRSWRARLARAEALEALGKAGEAETEFREAARLAAESDAGPAAEYGRFLQRQGRSAESIPVLEKAVAAHPDHAEAQLYLGRALFERGDLEGALGRLEKAVALAPASAQAHLLLAKAYLRMGRAAAAQEQFEAAKKYGVEK
jgi:Tfp pilus assembly protein PilF